MASVAVAIVSSASSNPLRRKYQRESTREQPRGVLLDCGYLPASEPCNFLPEFVVVAAAAVGVVVVVVGGGGGAGGSCGEVVFWVLGQFRQSIVVFRRSNGTHEV